MIKRLLILVFLGFSGAALAQADARDPDKLKLASANALILDAQAGVPIYAKAANEVSPIASLTKLMTAMVVLDSGQSLDELLEVDLGDFDFLKGSRSRLHLGTQLPRREMLRLALMSSENRAASALARHYPGGTDAFVTAMNAKARALGLARTRFDDPTGLSPKNVSTATDLAAMVRAAAQYPLIREYSTTPSAYVEVDPAGRVLGLQQLEPAGRVVRLGNPAAEDRLHPRGRPLPGHARQHREPPGRHRAARLDRQAHAARRRRARQALDRDRRRPAAADLVPRATVAKAKGPVRGTMKPVKGQSLAKATAKAPRR